jgi:glyoxylase-like metal-dependent hydrolase (beta-lactamase superfamily II)
MVFPHGRADRAQPRRARAGKPGRTPVEREADCRHPDIDGRAANPRSGQGLVNDYRRSEAVVLTHYHPDHMGNAERLRTQAGAAVLVHHDDRAAAMRKGRPPWYPLWKPPVLHRALASLEKIEPVKARWVLPSHGLPWEGSPQQAVKLARQIAARTS